MDDTSSQHNEYYEKVMRRCVDMYDRNLTIDTCLKSMYYANKYAADGYTPCPKSLNIPRVGHNYNFFHSNCGAIEIAILQYVLPPLMLFCFSGNMLNWLIYRLQYFEGNSSVHFLRVKALTNTIFVMSRVFEVVHAWTLTANEPMEKAFWSSRVYIITLSNISGTMSTWLTLMVTVETLICVLRPFLFKQLFTKKLTFGFLIISFFLSTLLHSTLIYLLKVNVIGEVRRKPELNCFYGQISYNWGLRAFSPHMTIQKIYYWTQMAVAIIIPTVAMLVCSVLIVKQFTFKDLGEAFSQRRKCVIRMTVSTTLSHLLLEGPATMTHAAVALKGGITGQNDYVMCALNHGNNLLSVVNATIPFYVFLLCSDQFRHMTKMYIRALLEPNGDKKKMYLQQAGMRRGRVNRLGATEMTFADNNLLASKLSANAV